MGLFNATHCFIISGRLYKYCWWGCGCSGTIIAIFIWIFITSKFLFLSLSLSLSFYYFILKYLLFFFFLFRASLLQAYHVTDAALGYFSPKQSHSLSILRLQSCWELTNHGIVNIGKCLSMFLLLIPPPYYALYISRFFFFFLLILILKK